MPAPTIEIGDPPLRIYTTRDGDRVTGRVEFPYETYGRTSCPIDYHSNRQSAIDNPQSPISNRASRRLAAVKRYHKLHADQPGIPKSKLLGQVHEEFHRKFDVNTLRVWNDKYELEGESGLLDHYTPRPKKVLSLDAQQATDAVTVCAWWIFRIGNPDIIDTKMIHTASALCSGATGGSPASASSFPLADILATIDCYYSWPCDRRKMPFKPFVRWAKYDFEKWLYRACDTNDYRRGLEATRKGHVPLQSPIPNPQSPIPNPPDARTRKRDVLAHGNRQAISALSPFRPSTFDLQPFVVSPSPPPSSLQRFGLADTARRIVAESAPGIPAMCANQDPQTVAEALGTLDDSYRAMLLSAAKGDRDYREEAITTLPMWWDAMPESLRGNIEFKVDAWRRDHPRVTDRAVAQRKVFMLLPHLRKPRGLRRLAVAARIPT